MKNSHCESGFALPIVLMIIFLLGALIVGSMSTSQIDVKDIESKRLLSTAGDIANKVGGAASLASVLRTAVATNTNLSCVNGGTCTAGGPYDLILNNSDGSTTTPVSGGSTNPIFYNIWEQPCPTPIPVPNGTCPIAASTQFYITCPGGAGSCPSSQASIAVIYTVQKANSTYPGVFAPISAPTPVPVPVPCINLVGPTVLGDSDPSGCY
jgi:hypothetical protein